MLHALQLKNPDVLLNVPGTDTKGKLKIPKDLVQGSPDTTVYEHNKTSRDCLLKCKQDGEAMEKNLREKSRVYVETQDNSNHCFYESVLTSLHEHIKNQKTFTNTLLYT